MCSPGSVSYTSNVPLGTTQRRTRLRTASAPPRRRPPTVCASSISQCVLLTCPAGSTGPDASGECSCIYSLFALSRSSYLVRPRLHSSSLAFPSPTTSPAPPFHIGDCVCPRGVVTCAGPRCRCQGTTSECSTTTGGIRFYAATCTNCSCSSG
jgi:hypothetical protein